MQHSKTQPNYNHNTQNIQKRQTQADKTQLQMVQDNKQHQFNVLDVSRSQENDNIAHSHINEQNIKIETGIKEEGNHEIIVIQSDNENQLPLNSGIQCSNEYEVDKDGQNGQKDDQPSDYQCIVDDEHQKQQVYGQCQQILIQVESDQDDGNKSFEQQNVQNAILHKKDKEFQQNQENDNKIVEKSTEKQAQQDSNRQIECHNEITDENKEIQQILYVSQQCMQNISQSNQQCSSNQSYNINQVQKQPTSQTGSNLNNKEGFSPVLTLLMIVILVLVVMICTYIWHLSSAILMFIRSSLSNVVVAAFAILFFVLFFAQRTINSTQVQQTLSSTHPSTDKTRVISSDDQNYNA